MATSRRLSFHGKVVAYGFLLSGLAGIAITLAALLFFGGIGATLAWTSPSARDPGDALAIGGLYLMVGIAFAVGCGLLSAPSFVTGWWLLRGSRRAVPAAVAISLLAAFFFFPIGTALGGYATWALCFDPARNAPVPAASEREEEREEGGRGAGWLVATCCFVLLAAAVFAALGLGLPMARHFDSVVPAAVGTGLGVLAVGTFLVGMRARSSVARSRSSRDRRIEHDLVRALATGRRMTVLEAAAGTGETIARCEAVLDRLAAHGHVRMDIGDRGETTYLAT